MVYVLSHTGSPLMPTKRYGKVRRMLKNSQARVIKAKPFTIQITYETTNYTQPVTLGIDAGYQTVGFSAVTEKEELIAGECQLLTGQVERNTERQQYRRIRRNRLRYRKPRFDNRRKPKDWLADSIQHKLDSHIRLVNLIKSLVPVTKVIVEVASFDTQAIKNPGIQGKEYQQGEQYGFWNLREYILHRDNHQCQNPDCKSKTPELQVHHIGYWKGDKTDRPGNLTTLCIKCHRQENHKPGKLLWGWEPKLKPFRSETFMTTVRWRMVNALACEHTYGYITKTRRIDLKLPKSHANDAFVVAGGSTQTWCKLLEIQQVRRNNRSLQKFYDAKYIDIRTGKKVTGQDLNCGRRTRNQELNGPNLRIYRGQKLSKGRVQIRKRRYPFQSGDTVILQGNRYTVKGTQN
ncbi:MAG: RNA-guided endonuclease IscB, partial [Syntrophaceticus sp.]|nr:RNA-guided endonuclease IscB [Syntrophaceticus sp.]MDD4360179.1 RNA-guided endonuclease IscB [Syntrophaceticus sp.]